MWIKFSLWGTLVHNIVYDVERSQDFPGNQIIERQYWLEGTVVADQGQGVGGSCAQTLPPAHMTRIVILPQNKAQRTGRTRSRLHHSAQRCLWASQNLRFLSITQSQRRQQTPWDPCQSLPTEDLSTGKGSWWPVSRREFLGVDRGPHTETGWDLLKRPVLWEMREGFHLDLRVKDKGSE